jgi:uncharacterized Zn finger protein
VNITAAVLSKLISEPYFTRGREYANKGLVKFVSIKSDKVIAHVAGTHIYRVIFSYKKTALMGDCSCQAFYEFGPCKHMAATGFAFIEYQRNGYKPSEEYEEQARYFDDFSKTLNSKTKKELINFILQLTNDYPDIMYDLEE